MAASGPLVKLDIDDKQLRELERVFRAVPKAIPVVMSAGINDAAKQGRTQVKDGVAAEVNLKKGFIDERLRLTQASESKMSAVIHTIHKGVPLIEYAPKGTLIKRATRLGRQGPRMRIRVKRKGPAEVKGNRFVAIVPGKRGIHAGIFSRAVKGEGLPIREQYGPSVTGTFQGAPGLEKRVLAKIHNALERRIYAQMNLVLEGKRFKQFGRALGVI